MKIAVLMIVATFSSYLSASDNNAEPQLPLMSMATTIMDKLDEACNEGAGKPNAFCASIRVHMKQQYDAFCHHLIKGSTQKVSNNPEVCRTATVEQFDEWKYEQMSDLLATSLKAQQDLVDIGVNDPLGYEVVTDMQMYSAIHCVEHSQSSNLLQYDLFNVASTHLRVVGKKDGKYWQVIETVCQQKPGASADTQAPTIASFLRKLEYYPSIGISAVLQKTVNDFCGVESAEVCHARPQDDLYNYIKKRNLNKCVADAACK